MKIHKLIFPFRLISKDNNKSRGLNKRYYLPKKFKDFERKAALYAKKQYKDALLEGRLKLRLTAYFTSKRHIDLPNAEKSLCDALQGIVYKNDNQIKHINKICVEDAREDYFAVEICEMGRGISFGSGS